MTDPDPDAGHERTHLYRGAKFYRGSEYVYPNINDCSCQDPNCVWIRQSDETWKRFNFRNG